MMSDENSSVRPEDVREYDDVGRGIAMAGRWFLRLGYDPETIAHKMRKNAELFDGLKDSKPESGCDHE